MRAAVRPAVPQIRRPRACRSQLSPRARASRLARPAHVSARLLFSCSVLSLQMEAAAATSAGTCSDAGLVPQLGPERLKLLSAAGITITPLVPLGAEVRGVDLRKPQSEELIAMLQLEMAGRGFLAFKDQGKHSRVTTKQQRRAGASADSPLFLSAIQHPGINSCSSISTLQQV